MRECVEDPCVTTPILEFSHASALTGVSRVQGGHLERLQKKRNVSTTMREGDYNNSRKG